MKIIYHKIIKIQNDWHTRSICSKAETLNQPLSFNLKNITFWFKCWSECFPTSRSPSCASTPAPGSGGRRGLWCSCPPNHSGQDESCSFQFPLAGWICQEVPSSRREKEKPPHHPHLSADIPRQGQWKGACVRRSQETGES